MTTGGGVPDSTAREIADAAALLGPLEGRIMQLIWSGGTPVPFVVRDLLEHLPTWAYSTVVTTVAALSARGVLAAESVPRSRAHRYRPRVGPAELITGQIESATIDLVRRYGEGALVAFAVRLDALDPEHRDRVQAAAVRRPDRRR